MIILEGPDGAGKTTLKQKIIEFSKRNRVLDEVVEGERGTSDRSKLYTVTVSDTFNALTMAVRGDADVPVKVWDRLFYSEFIYHKYTDRPCQFTDGQRRHINEIIRALHCPVVLCMPPYEEVHKNVQNSKQMLGVVQNIRQIYDDYNTLYHHMPPQTVVFDYTVDPTDRVLNIVGEYLYRRTDREW